MASATSASLTGVSSPALALPPRGIALAALVAVWLLPGLFGHAPWKTEDAIGLGIVHSMLETGDLRTLALAGEPYTGSGPLYFWLASASAKLFGAVLPMHDAARIASLACVLAALYFTRLAGRELYGRPAGDLSLLALMGSLGVLIHAREATPAVAALAAVAAAYYGIAIAWKKPLKAGLVFGAGAAGAFLADGLPALAPPLAAAVLLIPFALADRAQSYTRAVLLGLAILFAVVTIWLAALEKSAPEYLRLWLDEQWRSVSGAPRASVSLEHLKTLAWAAWPAWPLALWAAWAYRRNIRNPGFTVPFVAALVALVLLVFSDASRETDTLVLTVPLAIPAGVVALELRRGAANALAWFALMTAGLLAIALWTFWFAMQTGVPLRLAERVAKLEPGYVPSVEPAMLIAALLISALWVWYVLRTEISTLRALPYWCAGLALVWGLAMTLWLGWIDYGKSYGPVARGAAGALAAIRPAPRCIASTGLGEVQRAVFHYQGGILTERMETGRGGECPVLLVQTTSSDETAPEPGRWTRIWEGARPRDRERYRLYHRAPAARPQRR